MPYGVEVLVDSPFEARAVESLNQKDFYWKKATQGLAVNTAQQLYQQALAPKQLSNPEEGACIKFGSFVQLKHSETGVLSFDADEQVKKADLSDCIACTTSRVMNPCTRNTMIIVRADEKDNIQHSTDYLHYGQAFRIWCFDAFNGEGGWLHSELKGELSASKISKNQECCFHESANAGTLWRCISRDNRKQLSMFGKRVEAWDDVVLQHNMSASYLSSDAKNGQDNLFGCEFEVCCQRDLSKKGHQKMFSERKGMITGDINQKTIGGSCSWQFILHGEPVEGRNTSATKNLTAAEALEEALEDYQEAVEEVAEAKEDLADAIEDMKNEDGTTERV